MQIRYLNNHLGVTLSCAACLACKMELDLMQITVFFQLFEQTSLPL